MIVKTEDMVKAVRVAIDMNRTSTALEMESDIDTLSLDEIIRTKLEDGVRLVHMEAPIVMLESADPLPVEYGFHIDDEGKGWFRLPDDFMRLVIFKMDDWRRPVYEAISEDDALYKLQGSRWRGVYGTAEKPVVAVVRRIEGKVLEFFSCDSKEARMEQGLYMKLPKIEGDIIEVSADCYESAVYRTAALALGAIGDQLSGTMLEMSRSLL